MHRPQQVAWILLVLLFVAWPLTRWLAKRRGLPIEPIRRWFWLSWLGMFAITLGPELYAHPGRNFPMLVFPFLLWVLVYLLATRGKVSMKPLEGWLWVASTVLLISTPFAEGHSFLRQVITVALFSASVLLSWIQHRYAFETIGTGKSQVRFRIPKGVRVNVKNPKAVVSWYTEKLGFRPITQPPENTTDRICLKRKEDGNPVVLVPPSQFRSFSYPVFFTESIQGMRDALAARGVEVGQIVPDRMGTRNFEMRDAEGNVIDVVEE